MAGLICIGSSGRLFALKRVLCFLCKTQTTCILFFGGQVCTEDEVAIQTMAAFSRILTYSTRALEWEADRATLSIGP